ncbi:unnamed protein product [Knipowitschia caucasica]|uniref:Apolipoprotein M n=1 Tax=Knipowitschia caucasica TaxID=637954 RepID=A0AAV2LQE9_KNICA
MLLHKLVSFLLIFTSLVYSAPLTCEQLTQPAERIDPRNLEGTWALIGGSISYLPYLEIFGQRDSALIHFPSHESVTNISYSRGLRLDGKCMYSTSNITLNGSRFTFDGTPAENSSCVFVRTSCSDCLPMLFDVDSGQRTHFYLFSRRRGLEQDEKNEFMEQVRCLQMPPPVFMDPTKQLCPWPEETLN